MIIAFDTETFPIDAAARFPRIVCLTFASSGNKAQIITDAEPERIKATVLAWLKDDTTILVGHNVGFDLHCLRNTFPELESAIWAALEAGRITDTRIREKLLNLSTTGRMDEILLPDGSTKRLKYSLGDLIQHWLGENREEDKHGEESWRRNYHLLSGLPADRYPEDAARYALQDASDTLALYFNQEERVQKNGSLNTQFFQTCADWALKYLTDRGFKIDQAGVQDLLEELKKEIAPEKLDLLVETGILRPAIPARPYKNNPSKYTQAKPPSINRKRLLEIVEQVAGENGISLRYTDKGKISADSEMIKELAEFSPVLKQYQDRQKVYRLISTELPKLDAPEVFPEYDVLKETGRTSSFGGKLYPSTNIQQVDPRARHLFLPRENMVLCSIDYNAIELVSLAQTLKELFGHSTLAELLQSGKDPHAYLGAHLAVNIDPEFGEAYGNLDSDQLYEFFVSLKHSEQEEERQFYAHWRKFAKPVGLGYPGGLGAATMVDFAKLTYDIKLDEDTARYMKELWLNTFPEMVEYFQYINLLSNNEDEFSYTTPMGMLRVGASYCAAANGVGLQSRTAEGAKIALFKVLQACYDPTQNSILYGQAFPLAFIHDEIILEIKEGPLMSDVADEAARIWREGMKLLMTQIPVKAEPALMRHWNKKAETIRTSTGELQIWEEKSDG
jgi:DNA polymerase-1